MSSADNAKRREQNRKAQALFRAKKRRAEAAREEQLVTTERELHSAEAENDELRHRLTLYENPHADLRSPFTITQSGSHAMIEQATQSGCGDRSAEHTSLSGTTIEHISLPPRPDSMTASASPAQSTLPSTTVVDNTPTTWPESNGNEITVSTLGHAANESIGHDLVQQPCLDLASQYPTWGDRTLIQQPSSLTTNDLLTFALTEWEKSEQYAIRSAEQYHKAAETTAHKAQSLFDLYKSMNQFGSGAYAGLKINGVPSYQTMPLPWTDSNWAPAQNHKYLLEPFDENINILDPHLSVRQ